VPEIVRVKNAIGTPTISSDLTFWFDVLLGYQQDWGGDSWRTTRSVPLGFRQSLSSSPSLERLDLSSQAYWDQRTLRPFPQDRPVGTVRLCPPLLFGSFAP